MNEYVLTYKERSQAKGDLLWVLDAAKSRGAILAVTPIRRGYRYRRITIDLADDYEIKPYQESKP